MWKTLGISGKPTGKWFRIFKLYPSLCQRAYSNIADAGAKKDPEKYFYWLVGHYRKQK
jgi:hypothetical protein